MRCVVLAMNDWVGKRTRRGVCGHMTRKTIMENGVHMYCWGEGVVCERIDREGERGMGKENKRAGEVGRGIVLIVCCCCFGCCSGRVCGGQVEQHSIACLPQPWDIRRCPESAP